LNTQQGAWSRKSFFLLITECKSSDLENYLLQIDFAAVIISSLAGIFAALPEPSNLDDIKKTDFDGFLNFYRFFQRCITQSTSDIMHIYAMDQFKSFFLEKVVLSSFREAGDDENSMIALVFYIQSMIEITENSRLFTMILQFLFETKDEEELRPRDILLTKVNSLSVDVVICVLQLLDCLLSKSGGFGMALFFSELSPKNEVGGEFVKYSDIKDTIGKYLSLLSRPEDQRIHQDYGIHQEGTIVKDDLAEECDFDSQVFKLKSDPTLTKLLGKLKTFFSQSPKTNIALTNLILTVVIQKNPVLFKTLLESLYSILQKLNDEKEAFYLDLPDYEIKMQKLKCNKLKSMNEEDVEELRNILCLESFTRRLVKCVMMR
jgi:hypothetical protein